MTHFRAVQPHGAIQPVFDNSYFVTGTNRIHYEGRDIQTSRNMIILREGGVLTLINTVRLDEVGLDALDKLGQVKHVVRIGAFHGYDDPFYLDRYNATYWGAKGMQTDKVLGEGNSMPFSQMGVYQFKTSAFPECVLLVQSDAGQILITCDCIQNWVKKDPYFSEDTFAYFKQQGLIGPANIPNTWLQACHPDLDEFNHIEALDFQHLLSAHGEPLLHDAHEKLSETLRRMGV